MTIAEWVSPDDLKSSTSDLAPRAATLASRILFNLTGRIYGGEKSVIETYVSSTGNYQDSLRDLSLVRYGIGTICRTTPYRIGVEGNQRIPLRMRPVRSVESVIPTPLGVAVDPSSYWVESSTYLALDATVPVTAGLTVEYTYGTNPPSDGVEAARALADELVMLFNDDNQCRLKNVTSYSRQGVNFEIEDAKSILTDGRTGIPEVDLFVASVNPTRARLRSRVYSPDAHQAR